MKTNKWKLPGTSDIRDLFSKRQQSGNVVLLSGCREHWPRHIQSDSASAAGWLECASGAFPRSEKVLFLLPEICGTAALPPSADGNSAGSAELDK